MLDFSDWTLSPGRYWLKGGNGTGKSTLFKIISGQTTFEGNSELDGIVLRKSPITYRSKISYAEAEPQYPLFITGQELIDFYMKVRNESSQQARELAHYFGLTDFLNNEIGGYSSGMMKKLSLVCAFIGQPDWYILDEPLITIDLDCVNKLYALIKERSLLGKSFLLSSHQPVSAEELTLDGIFEISGKQILQRK